MLNSALNQAKDGHICHIPALSGKENEQGSRRIS